MGDHNVISDISGFKHKASEMRLLEGEQRGLLVHQSEWNPEHPQLHIRSREDRQNVTNVRVRTPDTFTTEFSETSLSNMLLFLDSSNASSLTLDSNNRVSAWSDLSSQNNNFAQSTEALRPTFSSAALNGKTGLIFDNDYLDTASDFMTADSYTVFLTVKFDPLLTSIFGVDGSGSNTFDLFVTTSALSGFAIGTQTLTTSVTHDLTRIQSGIIVTVVLNASAKTIICRAAGVQTSAFNASYVATGFDGNNPLRIGSSHGGGVIGFSGALSEFLVYEGAKTSTEILQMENFLTAKWLF